MSDTVTVPRALIEQAVEALDSAFAGVWDGYYGKGLSVEYARSVHRKISDAKADLRAAIEAGEVSDDRQSKSVTAPTKCGTMPNCGRCGCIPCLCHDKHSKRPAPAPEAPPEPSTPLASTVAKMLIAQRESFERSRPLCPDHRDKQRGECMACHVERMEKALREIEREGASGLVLDGRSIASAVYRIQLLARAALAGDREKR